MSLTANVGSADRILRLVLGAALIVLALMGTFGGWAWLAIVAGVILAGTAFLKFCPIYRIAGLKTTKGA